MMIAVLKILVLEISALGISAFKISALRIENFKTSKRDKFFIQTMDGCSPCCLKPRVQRFFLFVSKLCVLTESHNQIFYQIFDFIDIQLIQQLTLGENVLETDI